MKKLLFTIGCLALAAASAARAEAVNLFADLPESTFEYQTLKELHERGVLVGLKDGQFVTDKTLTVYEAAMSIVQSLDALQKKVADGSAKGTVQKGDVIALLEMKDSFGDEIAEIDERLYEVEDGVMLNSAEIEGLKGRVNELEVAHDWFQTNAEMNVRFESMDATESFAEYDATDFTGLPAGTPVALKSMKKRDVTNDTNIKLRMRLKFTSEVDDDVTLTGQFTNESNFGRVNSSGVNDTRFPGSEGDFATDVVMDQANIRWDINDKLALVAGRTQTTIGHGLTVDTRAPRGWLTGISATVDYFGDYILWASYDKVAENGDYSPLTKALVNDPVQDSDIDGWLFFMRGPFFSDKNEVGSSLVYVPEVPKWATVPGATAAAADKLLGDAATLRGQAAGLVATDPDGAALLRGQADLYETKAGQLGNLLANKTLMSYAPDVPGGLAFATDEYRIWSWWVTKGIGLFKNVYFEWAKNLGADDDSNDTAWQIGLDWGHNYKLDDWSFHAKYRRAESQSIAGALTENFLESQGYGSNRRLIELKYQYRVTPHMDLGIGAKWVKSLDPYIVNTDPFTIADDFDYKSIYGYMNAFF